MAKADVGLWGLAVMGQNLVLNMESKGFTVAVYNRTAEKTKKFAERKAKGKNIIPTYEVKDFIGCLAKPRKVMIMVKAGEPVDMVIEQILPHLGKADIIIDGGNSHFSDTIRRCKEIEEKGLLYIGTGVSGGEEGALKGPSIMPGGSEEAYKAVEPIFTKIAAQVDGQPCCTYIGNDGAGHFVKMTHNGIEYGDMQLICEAAAVYNGLPEGERQKCAVITGNYGEAGAMEYFGSELGLPRPISGHNSYWLWGPRDFTGEVAICFRMSEEGLRSAFESVEVAAIHSHPYAMPYESDVPIFVCRGLKAPVAELWQIIKHYD